MAREYEIVSTSVGAHYLLIGMNSDELAGFSLQLWIEKFGARAVDWAQSMGLNWISFMGGDLWIHNSDTTDRCNLFGEKRDCIVGIVANENPLKIKLLDSIGIHSNDEWEITSITIPATLNHPQGMSSKIPTQLFKKRDGIWRAKFLRNMKSSGSTESVMDAIKGEPLKGYYAYLLMKNTSTEQVKLFKVDINMTTSRNG
jgi:hypothetical protein